MRLEQNGFIKSRFILDNIIVVWEGMEWASHSKQNAIFLKIDFVKAYDRIEWSFILVMLQALGFSPHFSNLCRCNLGMPLCASPSMVTNLLPLDCLDIFDRASLLRLPYIYTRLKTLGICLPMPLGLAKSGVFPCPSRLV